MTLKNQSAAMKAAKKRIRTLYREGKTIEEIAAIVNGEGLVTRLKTPWSASSIGGQLRSVGIRRRINRAKTDAHAKVAKMTKYVPTSPLIATMVSILSHKSLSAEDRIAMALLFAGAAR